MKSYRLREWIALMFGCLIITIQIIRYAFDNLGNNWVELFVFSAGFLLIFAPKSLLSIIKKKTQ